MQPPMNAITALVIPAAADIQPLFLAQRRHDAATRPKVGAANRKWQIVNPRRTAK